MVDAQHDVLSVVSEVFSPLEISSEDSFDDLEATSILLLRLMLTLRDQFEIPLDVVDMFDVETIGDLVQLVNDRVAEKVGNPA
jgi:acyl carrier protein